MDWEVSEKQRYDRVFVSGHVSDGVGTWIGRYRRSKGTTVFLYRARRNMDWARYKNEYRDRCANGLIPEKTSIFTYPALKTVSPPGPTGMIRACRVLAWT